MKKTSRGSGGEGHDVVDVSLSRRTNGGGARAKKWGRLSLGEKKKGLKGQEGLELLGENPRIGAVWFRQAYAEKKNRPSSDDAPSREKGLRLRRND